MLQNKPADRLDDEWAIHDLQYRVSAANDRMLPIALLIMFGFTPLAQLILHIPFIMALPDFIRSLMQTYLVYILPALVVLSIWRFRQRRKVKDQQRLDVLVEAYHKKWNHASVIDK